MDEEAGRFPSRAQGSSTSEVTGPHKRLVTGLNKEVQMTLDLRVVEPSATEWSSRTMVIVTKKVSLPHPLYGFYEGQRQIPVRR